ncbi:sugar ABC transporter ATP-binding protein [Treponema sp.]
MQAVLKLSRIVKGFGDDFRLEDINIDVFSKEVHVIVGENGSGKSALMKLIGGHYTPDFGSLLLEGEELNLTSISDAKGHGIMYRPQEPQLFANMTVEENLYFDQLPRGKLGGLDAFRLRSDAHKLFQELGIKLDPRAKVSTLGYAQRQLLEAAKACVGTWKVVAFDEPSAAMAEPEREVLYSIVRRLKDEGVAVFYVSHRLDEILKVGTRVSVMRQGRIVYTQSVDTLDRTALIRIMTGQLQTERYPRFERKSGKPVLETVSLKSGHILRDVSFQVHKGEIIGITGLMGSGRTRLAQCLFGAVQPSGGELLLDGIPVRFKNPSDALKPGIALVPEDRSQNAILHRQDLVLNITLASLHRFKSRTGFDFSFMHSLVKDYSQRLGVRPGRPSDKPDQYSGGNQQKVAVARWLARRSRIYILDEPTRGIDVASKVDVYNAIADLVSKGASVILISSDIEEILGLCDRILVLAGGRIVCNLKRAEATQELILGYATSEE